MKTTLELPDELLREVKIRAVNQNRRLKDVIADLLRRGLSHQESDRPVQGRHRVRLPLVQCAHEARPDEEMTPDRVAALLLQEEARQSSAISRGPV